MSSDACERHHGWRTQNAWTNFDRAWMVFIINHLWGASCLVTKCSVNGFCLNQITGGCFSTWSQSVSQLLFQHLLLLQIVPPAQILPWSNTNNPGKMTEHGRGCRTSHSSNKNLSLVPRLNTDLIYTNWKSHQQSGKFRLKAWMNIWSFPDPYKLLVIMVTWGIWIIIVLTRTLKGLYHCSYHCCFGSLDSWQFLWIIAD